jgi:ArsR family transcriptional regulator
LSPPPAGHVRAAIWTLTWCGLAAVGAAAGAPPAQAGHGAPSTAPIVQVEQVKRLLDEGQSVVLVDLRPEEGFQQGHLPGARSLPLRQLRRRYGEIPSTRPVVLYCACPPEELTAAFRFLSDEGYRNVRVLEDGFPGWVRHGYPLER